MKFLKIFSLIAGLSVMAVSCVKHSMSAPEVSFPIPGMNFFAAGGTQEVNISVSNAHSIEAKAWTDSHFKVESDWLEAVYESPKVKITASANETGKDRTAYVRVAANNSAGTAYASIKVVQAAGAGSQNPPTPPTPTEDELDIEFDIHELSFSADGGSETVSFTASGNYLYVSWYEDDLETEADWIDFEETENEDEITIVVSANTGEARTGYFVLFATLEDWDENEDADYVYDMIEITQEGASEGPVEPVSGDAFVKVTSASQLTDGWYLIVCENQKLALDGSLGAELDKQGNSLPVSISGGSIAATKSLSDAAFYYKSSDGSLSTRSGHYIGWSTADKNGLDLSTSSVPLTVSISGGDADIKTATSHHLRYNAASGQERFRFFKESTYTNQQAVQLYREPAAAGAPAFSVSTTVLSAGARGASVSFDITAGDAVEWKAESSDKDFCTLSLESGTGSATVRVSVLANTASEPRTAVITVSTGNEEVETSSYEITLTQGPASDGDIDDGTPGYDDNLVPRRKIRIL